MRSMNYLLLIIKLLVTLLLVGWLNPLSAQERSVKRGDQHYEDLSYYEAVLSYETAFARGSEELEAMRKLADSYRQIRDMENAEIWYRKLSRTNKMITSDYLQYAEVLRMNGKYELADQWMHKYAEANKEDGRSTVLTNSNTAVPSLLKDGIFKGVVRPLSSNTITADWAPTLMGGQLVIASSRTSDMSFKKYHGWDGKAFMDLYVGEVTASGDVPQLTLMNKTVNTKYHESNATFSAAGDEMYFTRNHLNGRYLGRSVEGVNNLQLYHSEKVNGKWKKAKGFVYNDPEWSTGHPSLSTNGAQLFFASDRPGGYGGTDIYVCVKQSDGTWGAPKNLGARVNTEGNEMSPFYHKDGTLFFSSDGHLGVGGMDLFLSMMNGIEPGEVLNLGAPVNSRFDELCLTMSPDGAGAYFSSNRPGGAGDDDVYHVLLLQAFDREQFYSRSADVEWEEEVDDLETGVFNASRNITALTRDALTGEPLEGVQMMYEDQVHGGVAAIQATSNKVGMIKMDVPVELGKNNDLLLAKKGYLPRLIIIDQDNNADVVAHEKNMNVLLTPLAKGVDLGTAIGLEPVYFEVESWEVGEEAGQQLARIAFIMKTYPNIQIELGSHTDSQGSAGFNDILSDMRANASKDHLVNLGIDAARISARGYGENALVNRCAEGISCTEEEHRMNRRTEFIVQDY